MDHYKSKKRHMYIQNKRESGDCLKNMLPNPADLAIEHLICGAILLH